ncbi:DL-methionine transporter ATP-binding subunit [Pedobacter sp. BAL39]|nr:DL-methionine transporter ATP-binding subunit [Pedobacter sp. BAL39]
MLNGTNAASTPIDVPTNILVKGIIHTIRMMNGMDRKMDTNADRM